MKFILRIIILLLFFRSLSAVIFPLIVVGIGVVLSLGTLVLFGYKITLLTALIPPLIVVIGIPNCILLLNKYHTEYMLHQNKVQALSIAVKQIGITTFYANVTTAIGFGVFAFTKSEVLDSIAKAYHFTRQQAKNYDPLLDALTTLIDKSGPQPGFVVVLEGLPCTLKFDKDARETLLDVFRDAVEYWAERRVPYRVFYSFAN